jgi:hypothetical protein
MLKRTLRTAVSLPDGRRLARAIVMALLAATYYTTPANAVIDPCEEVCTVDSLPEEACWYTPEDNQMPAFEGDCELYGVYYEPGYCGDGYCGEGDGESPSNCESDCFIGPGSSPSATPTCGNSQCEAGESNRSCPADCAARNPQVCGDGVCELSETESNCPADCYYTDFCWNTAECPGWATCRARRCVYDPGAMICNFSEGGYYGCFAGDRCAQVSGGIGICVPVF